LFYDGGIYQELFGGAFFFDLTYFVQEYKDKIIWISSKYDNLEGKVKNSGVELSSGIKILSFLRTNYSYTYIKYDETNDSSATLKRPAHKHAASVTVIPLEGLDITASYIYSVERKDVYYDPATWSQSIVTLHPIINLILI
jgi:outer membrane receptor protein involved in Fe transport